MDASDCDVASTNWTHWHGIPWRDAHQVVGRLQARIAKAAKAGDWRTVRRLQRLRPAYSMFAGRSPVSFDPGFRSPV
jgi:hypothetical protein